MVHIIKTDALTPPQPEVQAMAQTLYQKNPAVLGVLFYGSGLWKALAEDTVLDFYLIVDSYKAYKSPLSHRFWGSILPPNVYYAEHKHQGKTLRCKYAVMALKQFKRAAQGKAIAPSIWARFSQPCQLVYSKNEHAQEHLLQALADANTTFHKRTLPLLKKAPTTTETLWTIGLGETYSCELRSEKKGRNQSIYSASPQSFDQRTQSFARTHPQWLESLPAGAYCPTAPQWRRLIAHLNTPLRRLSGKVVTLLRLIKAPLTFTGAVEYIVWKLERHTGERIKTTPFQRKHPLIGGWPLLFKVLKKRIAR